MRVSKEELITIMEGFGIDGFVHDQRRCATCYNDLLFYHDYDASFCVICNEWIEKNCGDSTCDYCKDRPARPVPYTKP